MAQVRSHTFIQRALDCGAFSFDPKGYTLKDGRESPYFFDLSKFSDGSSMTALCGAFVHQILTGFPGTEVVYGPPVKGSLIAPTIAVLLSYIHQNPIGWATSRKTEKGYAEKGSWLGTKVSERQVVIVDDVFSSGDTKRETIELIEKNKGEVIGILVAFDRLEYGGAYGRTAADEFTETTGIPVHSIASLADLLHVIANSPDPAHRRIFERLLLYQERYGRAH